MRNLWDFLGPSLGDPVTSLRKSYGIRYSYQFQHTYEPIQIKTLKCHTRYITVRIETAPASSLCFLSVACFGFRPTWIRIPRDTMCTAPTYQRMPPMRRPWQRSAPLFRRASRSGAKENFCDRTAADDGKKTESLAT